MKRELPSIDLLYIEEKEMIISAIYKSGYIRIVGSLFIDEDKRYRPWIKGRYRDFRYLSHKDVLTKCQTLCEYKEGAPLSPSFPTYVPPPFPPPKIEEPPKEEGSPDDLPF